jgi:hypothetical protein
MEDKKNVEKMQEFRMECNKCGATVKLQGTEEKLEEWLDSPGYMCPGRHVELGRPRSYLEFIEAVEIDQPYKWEPQSDRKYVDIHQINGLEHCGFGIFKNPDNGDIFDYETDETGLRHYYHINSDLENES